MSGGFDVKYYSDLFLSINCACVNGRKILAKPILLLTIIAAIEDKIVKENKFFWRNGQEFEEFHRRYKNLYLCYRPNEYLTPIFKPFFHIKNDGFMHHELKYSNNIPKTATVKYLTENLNYAYLDQELWDLLQDYNVREEFRELIINFFIKPKRD